MTRPALDAHAHREVREYDLIEKSAPKGAGYLRQVTDGINGSP